MVGDAFDQTALDHISATKKKKKTKIVIKLVFGDQCRLYDQNRRVHADCLALYAYFVWK